jgi:hypothetical protein
MTFEQRLKNLDQKKIMTLMTSLNWYDYLLVGLAAGLLVGYYIGFDACMTANFSRLEMTIFSMD